MGTPLFTYTRLTSFVRYAVMPVAYAEQRGNYSSYTDYGVRRMPDGQPPCSLRSQTLNLLPYLHLSPHLGSASQHGMYTLCGITRVVSDTITSYGIDLLIATESWHQTSSDVAVRRSTPPGYSAVDRSDGSSYGGIVIFHRSHLSVRRMPLSSSPTTFEALTVSVSSPRGPLTILAAYRPGSTSSLFFHEFAVLLEQFALYNAQLVITGESQPQSPPGGSISTGYI